MAQTQARARGWHRIALPASIVLNLFLVALIGAHLFRVEHAPTAAESPLARALANAEASLSPTDAAAFRQVLRGDAQRYAGAAMRLSAARDAVRRQIVAEPFDADAVRQALGQWRAAV
ncbi:MAG TPA: periplasmic heavy metal sensor, partial [Rhodopila sp.]|uniref:periplasmic heavy metal sensor n=1 Tax=Rhodopila sp. TaxID=2480087 RepID=UPI002C3808B2